MSLPAFVRVTGKVETVIHFFLRLINASLIPDTESQNHRALEQEITSLHQIQCPDFTESKLEDQDALSHSMSVLTRNWDPVFLCLHSLCLHLSQPLLARSLLGSLMFDCRMRPTRSWPHHWFTYLDFELQSTSSHSQILKRFHDLWIFCNLSLELGAISLGSYLNPTTY